MNPMIRFVLFGSLLLLFAHRSPAPVSEPDKPTPTPSATAAPEQSATPKPKHSPTAKPIATENEIIATPIVAHASAPHPQKSSSRGSSRLIYSPTPGYPVAERFARTPVRGSGDFRVTFGPNGDVTKVQTVRSTNHDILDEAAMTGLRRWKSRPGAEWSTTVPMEFKP